jgi:hypothetical protein
MAEAQTYAGKSAHEAPQAGKGRGSRKKAADSAAKRTKPTRGRASPATAKARPQRTATKQERLIAMLRSNQGTTIEEIVKAFGWQPHTVRGAFAGALKKKLGLTIVSGDGRAPGQSLPHPRLTAELHPTSSRATPGCSFLGTDLQD